MLPVNIRHREFSVSGGKVGGQPVTRSILKGGNLFKERETGAVVSCPQLKTRVSP
jgi:hypothetical protein